jgi:hypothetical protein
MTLISIHLYHALKAVGATEDAAFKAAEEAASYENRFSKLEADMRVIKWMLGFVLAMVATILFKLFAQVQT